MTSAPDAAGTHPAEKLDTSRPFSRTTAITRGLTDGDLRSGRFTQVLWGVHVAAEVELDHLTRCRAALVALPDGVISGRSAAKLWGAIVPDSADIEVLLDRRQTTAIHGIRMHRPPQRPATTRRYGVSVTTPEATFLRLAAELELVDLVVAGDTLVKKATSPKKLVDAAATYRGKRARLARRAAALVRSGVDSPQESKVRLLVVLAGLPEPTVNIEFRDDEGNILRRLDMGYREPRVAIEYDGRQHAENDQQWQSDIDRREEFDDLEWRFVIVRSPGLFTHPDQTLSRIVKVLSKKGMRVRISSNEWRRHFPVRRAAA